MLQYNVKSKQNPQDRSEVKYYLEGVSRGRIELTDLLKQVCDDSTIDPNEVTLGLRRTFKKAIEYLTLGFTVHLDDLGYFNLRISSEGAIEEEAATPDMIRKVRLVFYPGKQLRNSLKNLKFQKKKQ